MNIRNINEQIIKGKRLTKEDALSFLLNGELDELTECVDKLRKYFSGGRSDLCSIINGRSGRCSEDCKFCAQSAHHCTGIEEYAFLDKHKIVSECQHNEAQGVDRFAIVTSGRNLMTNCGERAFLSGANSAITGDMLTTSGNRIREDIAMLNKIGYSTGRDNNA